MNFKSEKVVITLVFTIMFSIVFLLTFISSGTGVQITGMAVLENNQFGDSPVESMPTTIPEETFNASPGSSADNIDELEEGAEPEIIPELKSENSTETSTETTSEKSEPTIVLIESLADDEPITEERISSQSTSGQLITISNDEIAVSSNSQNVTTWRMSGRNLNRTYYYSGSVSSNISLEDQRTWSGFTTSITSPAIADGFIYIGDASVLRKFNASNVSQLIDTSPASTTSYITAPTLWGDFVYTTTTSTYYQLNTSNLSHTIASYGAGSYSPASVIIYDNYAFFASGSTDILIQANASNISQLIDNVSLTNCESNIAIRNDSLYLACSSTAYRLNVSNISQTYEQYSIGTTVDDRGGITVGDDYIYFNGHTNKMFQLNATNISQLIATYTAGNNFESGVLYGHNSVYAGSWDNNFYQLNSSNISQLIASIDTGAAIYYSSLVTDDYAFVQGASNIFQLDANNVSIVIAKESVGGNHNPPVVANGIVYAVGSGKVIQFGIGVPIISLDTPAADYITNTTNFNLTFQCSAFDDSVISNISLYITDDNDNNFALNQTTTTSEQNPSANWTLELQSGDYTWNCLAFDENGNSNWASSNRTVNPDIVSPSISFDTSNNTNSNDTGLDIQFTATDSFIESCWYSNDSYLENVSLDNCTSDITDVTWSVGEHNVTLWANDSSGNIGNSDITFTIDLTNPSFINLSNQSVAYNVALNYEINASDNIAIFCYSVNDTTNFQINCSGNLQNNTLIALGFYWVNITVNDTAGNKVSESISINVSDDTPPIFSVFANQTAEYGVALSYDIDATDDSGIASYEINDTTNFQIDGDGILTNNTYLAISLYNLNVTANDTVGFSSSSEMWVNVTDTNSPAINITTPSNTTNSTNSQLNVNFTTSDLNLASCWYSNDSYSINTTLADCVSNITTITWTEGQHNVTIWSNDSYDNQNSSSITFSIDTTGPTFDSLENQSLTDVNALSYDIDASDATAVDCFTVNDTTNFQIGCDGVLQNNTALSVSLYNLNITINDTLGNTNSQEIWVNVTSSPTISLTMVTPSGDTNVTANQSFTVSATVTCNNVDCGEVNVSLDPAVDTVYNFTSCGTTGKTGPTEGSCDTEYDGTTLDGLVGVVSGVQNWTVPETGTYKIEAYGAESGSGTYKDTEETGKGAYMSGSFSLTEGDIIFIAVGQSGESTTGGSYNGPGGGGGSFVVSNDDPLIIAGGGGASGAYSGYNSGTTYYGQNATIINDASNSSRGGAGGTGGLGGSTTSQYTYAAASGAGFAGNGSNGGGYPSSAGAGGLAFYSNLAGGAGATSFSQAGDGGFGGGGGGSPIAGGGGGGFSGGAGSSFTSSTQADGGGGGGSSNNGTSQVNTAGLGVGDGIVTITFVATASKSGLISTNTSATPFYTTDDNPQNVSLNAGASETITWSVNATGNLNTTHEFWVFANQTSDTSVSNETFHWNVTITNESVGPTVTISSPSSNAFSTDTSLDVTYTATSDTLDSCWYTTDSGVTNSSLVSCANITSVTWAESAHTVSIYANDTSGNEDSESITFTIDVTDPIISFVDITLNDTSQVLTFIEANITASDTNLANITIYIYNSTDLYNSSTQGSSPFFFNQTNLPDDTYYLNATVSDSADNENSTETRTITINTADTINPTISFIDTTTNSTNHTQTFIEANITASDTNLANITIYIYNSTDLYNSSTQGTSPFYFNQTNLPDDTYYLNATVNDTSGNSNSTETRTIIIDTADNINPSISFVDATTNSTNQSSNSIFANVTSSDDNLSNITVYIYNDSDSSQLYNSSNQTSSPFFFNQTSLPDSTYYLNATAQDTSKNINQTETRTIIIDSSNPSWGTNSTSLNSTTAIGSAVNFNITFNDSNPSKYIFSWYNGTVWTNNSPVAFTSGLANQISKTTTISYGEINWTWYFNDTIGNINQTDIFSIFVNSSDADADGINDHLDTLLYNESNVSHSGLSNLNITVGGNRTTEIFSNIQEVIFYDQTNPIVNFSHNFSNSSLDLRNVTIIKGDNSLIVNFSGQLQSNKTLFITDNSFVSLCVKDAEIASIDEVSSACTGDNETDFTTCLGSSLFSNGINCTDQGSIIKIENLQYSAIKGTQATSSSTTTTSTSGGGGGGGSSNKSAVASSVSDASKGESKKEFQCSSDSDCMIEYTCFQNQCVKLFDAKIIDLSNVIDGALEFTYFIKGMAKINGDVVVDFWLSDINDETIISSGHDTIYLAEFEEKTQSTKIFLPPNITKSNVVGEYNFNIKVSFENYAATSHRVVYLNANTNTAVLINADDDVVYDNKIFKNIGSIFYNYLEVLSVWLEESRNIGIVFFSFLALMLLTLISINYYLFRNQQKIGQLKKRANLRDEDIKISKEKNPRPINNLQEKDKFSRPYSNQSDTIKSSTAPPSYKTPISNSAAENKINKNLKSVSSSQNLWRKKSGFNSRIDQAVSRRPSIIPQNDQAVETIEIRSSKTNPNINLSEKYAVKKSSKPNDKQRTQQSKLYLLNKNKVDYADELSLLDSKIKNIKDSEHQDLLRIKNRSNSSNIPISKQTSNRNKPSLPNKSKFLLASKKIQNINQRKSINQSMFENELQRIIQHQKYQIRKSKKSLPELIYEKKLIDIQAMINDLDGTDNETKRNEYSLLMESKHTKLLKNLSNNFSNNNPNLQSNLPYKATDEKVKIDVSNWNKKSKNFLNQIQNNSYTHVNNKNEPFSVKKIIRNLFNKKKNHLSQNKDSTNKAQLNLSHLFETHSIKLINEYSKLQKTGNVQSLRDNIESIKLLINIHKALWKKSSIVNNLQSKQITSQKHQ